MRWPDPISLDEQSAAATYGLPPGGAAPPVGAGVAPAVSVAHFGGLAFPVPDVALQ